MDSLQLTFRTFARDSDITVVESIVRATGKFNDDEIAISAELITDVLTHKERSEYRVLFCESAGRVVGYTCYGFIRGSNQRYEVYWIAVDPSTQGKGIGRALMAQTERLIHEAGGVRVYVETSSRAEYHPTQAFYRAQGYSQAAFLEGYYHDSDGLLVFMKHLDVVKVLSNAAALSADIAPMAVAG